MTSNKEKQQQQLKKYLIYALMCIVCGLCLWWIFVPSTSDKNEKQQGQGFNDEIPSPADQGLPGDKRKVYELENLKKKGNNRMLTLNDYSLFPEEDTVEINKALPDITEPDEVQSTTSAIDSSVSSYKDISRSLGTFYEQTDPREQEILALEWRIQELEKKQEEEANRKTAINDQVELMEKSYEIAARYLPSSSPQQTEQAEITTVSTTTNGKKWKPVPVSNINTEIVSALPQQNKTDELNGYDDHQRNADFITAGKQNKAAVANTIKACIHTNQTILSGQGVTLRLLEPIRIDSRTLPVNSTLTGKVSLQGERLDISVSSIEYEGTIYPVQLTAYGNDGVQGLYVHSAMELDAAKEMIANMGTSMSGITITDNAGSQIAADLTRGLMQGTSQLFAKKLRMQKINLKAGHNFLLMADKD